MNAREKILKRVGEALSPLAKRAELPVWDTEVLVPRAAGGPEAVFKDRLHAMHGILLHSWTELFAFLKSEGRLHGYCDPALLAAIETSTLEGFVIETDFDRTRIDDYAFGITTATGAIAETGTLILTDGDTSRRLGALAPWVHVAVLKRETIVRTVSEAVATLPKDPNVIWVTGPSKTADVEGILIEGVHGPGCQIALLL